jgi:phospholipase C
MALSRKEFLKQTAAIAGTSVLPGTFFRPIRKAFSIDPKRGSSYLDAEHIVFLMQENRSFDHVFGTLDGIRGYHDPRAINLPNGNPVWLQSDEKGDTYAPFRFNIKDSKATWIGGLSHARSTQVQARNNGKYDKWLIAKRSGNYPDMPLTLGHYTRRDIPFYYALADAFTVCDQSFCSVLGPTSPNRVYFWSGTVREKQQRNSKAHVLNGEINYKDLQWQTFPEILEKHHISWKAYQNELSIPVGFHGQEAPWLANYTNNDLEFFAQYNVRLYKEHLIYIKREIRRLRKEIKSLSARNNQGNHRGNKSTQKELKKKRQELAKLIAYQKKWNQKRFEQLSEFEKDIHRRAFVNNSNDPDYHRLKQLEYDYEGKKRKMKIPEGDILYQFRKDVESGNLPAVSWLVAPQNYSDHPSAPWYGAWYVSEAMNILTENPEIWKKTIFILTYDENDGYFDHVPPFVAPDPDDPQTGAASKGIHTGVEITDDGPIGLGYRVPMVIASPWSRGGWVNSQVFDHTSNLQFLESFLSKKTGKKIQDSHISNWRRAICGDMTSIFRPYKGNKLEKTKLIDKKKFLESINEAQYKKLPTGYKKLSQNEIKQINKNPEYLRNILWQEGGARPACGLPYQLIADGRLNAAKTTFNINFEAMDELFGTDASGSAFIVYAPAAYISKQSGSNGEYEKMRSWNYAVKAGESVEDSWPLNHFKKGNYHLQVYGPNGFFREFRGSKKDPLMQIFCDYQRKLHQRNKLTSSIALHFDNKSHRTHKIIITDNAYGEGNVESEIPASSSKTITLNLEKSYHWYDFTVKVNGYNSFKKHYAGRVETGKHSLSDPQMGRSST